MSYKVEPLTSEQIDDWNEFVAASNEGTLFHRLDFLEYHGNRFRGQEHHLVIYKGSEFYSIIPMAIFEENDQRIAKSPYGGSYGGPVFNKNQSYHESHEILDALLSYLDIIQVTDFIMTLPLQACYRQYSETFRFVLIEKGFQCTNRDISSLVFLDTDCPVSEVITSRARNMVRKARSAGIEIVHGGSVKDFWSIMEKTFSKHGTSPTHSLEEFTWLQTHLPEHVYVDVAYMDGKPVAGIGYFVVNDQVNSSFYLCQDPLEQKAQGLSLLICEALDKSQNRGFRWFDFGTSSSNMRGSPNIFRFKESFGAIGIFRETYIWRHSSSNVEESQ
jgi:hypothetical protein